MKLKKLFTTTSQFLIKNYIITLFLGIVVFVMVILFFKMISTDNHYLYAKVKVSQGLWWASTQKPNWWYVQAVKKGEREGSLTGSALSEIVTVRHYPFLSTTNQHDIYMTVKLAVTKNTKTGKFLFKRSQVAAASPIDFEFPSSAVSGTVMAISEEPFSNNTTEKIVTITKKSAFPWEFDSITVGDTYHDGEEVVAEILTKRAAATSISIDDTYGNYPVSQDKRLYITVTLRLKGTVSGGKFIYGEEQPLIVGGKIMLATERFIFDQFEIAKIEDIK